MRNSWEDAARSALGTTGGSYNPEMGGVGGLLGGLFGSLFGDDGSQYSSQIPGDIQKYLGPYAQMGQSLIPGLESQYQGLMDPDSFMQKLASGFQTDPGFQFAQKQALNAANQAAAAGGMAGSPEAQQNAAQIASQMADQQYQDYLKNAMGLYGTGLRGLSGLEGQGFQAGGDMTSALSNYLQNQAHESLAQSQQMSQGIGGLLGGLLGFL